MTSFVAVICGLQSEATAIRAIIDGDARVRICVSGADAGRAYDLATQACAQGAAAVLSIGVSGGLDPALRPGDLIIGETVIGDDGDKYEADGYLLAVVRKSAPTRAQFGRVFGADDIIESASKKAALFSNHGALAVDMESHGAARAAAEAGAPFLAIRAIADPADRALPPAALGAVAPDGSTRVFKTLGAALRDPKQFPDLVKLGADSDAALKTLRRDLGLIFDSLFRRLDL